MAKDSIAARAEKRHFDEFEIKDAARTLIRAEEIRVDKPLMKKVDKELVRQKEAILRANKK